MTPEQHLDSAAATVRDRLVARGMRPDVAAEKADAARACFTVSGDGTHLSVRTPHGATPILGPDPLGTLAQIIHHGASAEERGEATATPAGADAIARERYEREAQMRAMSYLI